MGETIRLRRGLAPPCCWRKAKNARSGSQTRSIAFGVPVRGRRRRSSDVAWLQKYANTGWTRFF